jgi:hypothetical protein
MWQRTRDECDAMQAEMERLQKLRDRTIDHLNRVQTELGRLLVGSPEDEPEPLDDGELASVVELAVGDIDDDVEATADAGPELAEPADPQEPDSAPAVQSQSDQAGGAEPDPPAKASTRSRREPARSG